MEDLANASACRRGCSDTISFSSISLIHSFRVVVLLMIHFHTSNHNKHRFWICVSFHNEILLIPLAAFLPFYSIIFIHPSEGFDLETTITFVSRDHKIAEHARTQKSLHLHTYVLCYSTISIHKAYKYEYIYLYIYRLQPMYIYLLHVRFPLSFFTHSVKII